MSLKTQGILRIGEAAAAIGSYFTPGLLNDLELANDIITPESLSILCTTFGAAWVVDMLTAIRRERLDKDVIEAKVGYQTLINNLVTFLKRLNVEDPLSVYLIYNHLYKNGYLSYYRDFAMNKDNTLDLAGLCGIDIVRGYGSNKAVAAMLHDVYKKMNYSSFLIPGYLNTEEEIEKTVINMVSNGKYNILLNPIYNDYYFKKSDKYVSSSNNETIFEPKYGLWILKNILGLYSDNMNFIKLASQSNMPTISMKEYDEVLKEVNYIIYHNSDLFLDFYFSQTDVYEQIWNHTDGKDNLTRRLIPIIPKKKN